MSIFDSMTDGEIADYFKDRDRDYPTGAQIADYEERKSIEEHEDREHGGGPCTCLPLTPEQIEAYWVEQGRQHRAEAHDGGPCDCEPPF